MFTFNSVKNAVEKKDRLLFSDWLMSLSVSVSQEALTLTADLSEADFGQVCCQSFKIGHIASRQHRPTWTPHSPVFKGSAQRGCSTHEVMKCCLFHQDKWEVSVQKRSPCAHQRFSVHMDLFCQSQCAHGLAQ
ncbi:Hypothetical predicted protein [Podarcis lilfordi]|uniref:Uncharacterized protein n=1 Tax=Podarcis lilfordi TaxID=74358 RepID=A0AA35K2C5_9SAUR|nr:Hypothetical predicted protein [Podarcis lilfordi]